MDGAGPSRAGPVHTGARHNGAVSFRAVIGPLVSGATYRRGVHLLLGGVILLPYVMLTVTFAQMFGNAQVPRGVLALLVAVSAAIAAVPAFLSGTRALEIAAARSLLDVDLPEPPAAGTSPGIDRETRLRAALWFAAHLVAGGVVGLALLIALPLALVFIAQQFGVGTDALAGLRLGPLDEHDTGWITTIGLALLVGTIYLVAGLGALATVMAPVLLGPSQTERIAALEARAGQLAMRNRLARELHDSVGHALTVATLQAAAARELLDRDPQFARQALASIEEVGRRAMDDLDYVLGVLREQDSGQATDRAPQRTLTDLDRLVADTRTTGLRVSLEVTGSVDELPAAVSREGYRIVQEGLTNAARHAAGAQVGLRIEVSPGLLDIDLLNAVDRDARARADRSGRGLHGMRERVALLGGRMSAGRDDGRWRVSVQLPVDKGRRGEVPA